MPDPNIPGAVTRDLTPEAQATLTSAPVSGHGPISTGTGSDWMGPGDPMAPQAPPEVKGRQFDIRLAENLQVRPRADEAVSFEEMRALAQNYDVLRLVIETRKDQMERLTWSIQPKKMADGKPAQNVAVGVIQEITDFFDQPCPDYEWGTWLRMLLEDMFVCDAAALYPDRLMGRGGTILSALEPIDGTRFKRVIDNWGRTPQAPAPAYQQNLKGMPAVDYQADDLIYLPRNPRTHKLYGFSHVEQIITTVNIGLRRQWHQLTYFTDGNIPDGFIYAPDSWSPDHIEKAQKAWDALRRGNSAERSGRLIIVPGGQKYTPAKDPELSGKFDEWLARIVCYCLSVSPQPFVQQQNRSTAETAHDAAIEEGLAPVQNWVVRLMNRVIRRFWPGVPVVFSWNDDREIDGLVQMQILTGYLKVGAKTINEVRDVNGDGPVQGGDVPRALTPNGYVNVDTNDDAPTAGEAAQQKSDQATAMAAAAAKAPKPGEPAPPTEEQPAPKEEPATKGFRPVPRELRKSYWPQAALYPKKRPPQPPRPGGDAGGRGAQQEPHT